MKPGGHPGKLSRPIRTQQRIGTGNPRHATPTNDAASSFVPAPTPASNYRLVRHERHFLKQQQQQQIVSVGGCSAFVLIMFLHLVAVVVVMVVVAAAAAAVAERWWW